MARTSGDIVIAAKPADIMAVIADLASYPEWATGVSEVDIISTDAKGLPEKVRMTLNSPPIRDSYVLQYVWGSNEVTWELVEDGGMLKQLDGAYTLVKTGEGTQVTYQLQVDVKVPLLGKLKRKAEKVIIDAALKGLKQRIEGS